MDYSNYYKLPWHDVAAILSFMKQTFVDYPDAFKFCNEEDLKMFIQLQIAWDNYQVEMAYTE